MRMIRKNIFLAIIFIGFAAKCETGVDVRVGGVDSDCGALIGCRCNIYSGCPECVGPLWLPTSRFVVVGKENFQPSLLGANICMTLDSVGVKKTGLVHRIKVESSGVLAPKKTAGGGVVSEVIGCDNMYIDAVAEGADPIPDFLLRGIDEFCKPHGKSMEFAASTCVDAYSGLSSRRVCFVCEDGWMVILFGLVREKAGYAVECLVRNGKLIDAKGSVPVQVSSGAEMKIVRGKDEKCVVGIWNDEDDGVLRVNFVGEPASVFTSECIKSSKIEWLVQDLKNHMGEIRAD